MAELFVFFYANPVVAIYSCWYVMCVILSVERRERARLKNVKFTGKNSMSTDKVCLKIFCLCCSVYLFRFNSLS